MDINLVKNKNKNNNLKKLDTQDLVKVSDGEESFWAIVHKKLRNCIIAKIDNKLLFEKKYNYGDLFKCTEENILDHVFVYDD